VKTGHPVGLPSRLRAVQLCVAPSWACALTRPRNASTSDGPGVNEVWCWGSTYGAVSSDDDFGRETATLPVKVNSPAVNVTGVSCADAYACLAGSNGLYCFGRFWVPSGDVQVRSNVNSIDAPRIDEFRNIGVNGTSSINY